VVNRGQHLYQSRLVLSVLEDLPALLLASSVSTLLLLGIAGSAFGDTQATLGVVVGFGLCCTALLVLVRAITYATVRAGRRDGAFSHPVIIVGAGEVATRLTRALQDSPELGLKPVGMVDDGQVDTRRLPAPHLGGLARLPHAMHDLDVQDVIFAFGAEPDVHALPVVRRVQQMGAQAFVVPRFFELMGHDRTGRMESVNNIAILRLRRWNARPYRILAKRAFDIAVSATALLLLAPLLAAIAWAVRSETGPGVIFRQERVGRNGETFELMKFRSMIASTSESATHWNIDTDDRIGPVGMFLRRTGLDELPQLWNILRGDMTVVGPRPERPYFVDRFSADYPEYAMRHRVPVGLTGLAQVSGLRGDTPISDRARFDNYYIENWSLWLDVKVLLRTVSEVFRGGGR
jgi:exopolysaccharide biosynthesis polyprenyl glycosylphosphotransferase